MDVQLLEVPAVKLRAKEVFLDRFWVERTPSAQRMPCLDALRGVAILLVVSFHGLAYHAPDVNWGWQVTNLLYGLTAWGWLGVNLFFVISGFLITGILDDTVEQENYYSRFYLRRALRILPAYLAVIALAWATGFISRNYVVICLLFLANMPGLFLRHGYLFYGPFWSLAVEEQFYLAWPLLYRKLGRAGTLALSAGLMVLCPFLRWLVFAGYLHTGEPLSKTWMVADNLALGAMLALLLRWPAVSLRRFLAFGWIQFFSAVTGLGILFGLGHMTVTDPLRNSVGLSCFELLCGSAVVCMVYLFRERSLPGWMKIFVFFGKISYGLYLVHLLFFQIYDRVCGRGFVSDWRLLLLRFTVVNGAAIVFAVISKKFYEDPILLLKTKLATAR